MKKAGFDCLVILGGNGTHKTANLLRENGVNVVTLPKTIDNDLWGTELTFGFQSAVSIAVGGHRLHPFDRFFPLARVHRGDHGPQGRLADAARGHRLGRGRHRYPGDPVLREKDRAGHRKACRRTGKRFSIIAVAEGAVSREEAAMSKKEFKAAREAMPYPSVSYRLADGAEGADRAGDPRDHPRPFPARRRTLCGRPRALRAGFGAAAAELIREGKFGNMVALQR